MKMISRWALLVVAIAALLAGCAEERAGAHRQQGLVAMQRGDLAGAEKHFAHAADLSGTEWRSRLYLGRVLIKQNRPLDAQIQLEKALALRDHHPETPSIIDDLATSIYNQRQEDALIDLLERSAREYGTPRDYLRQADFLTRLGRIDAARVAYLKAIRFAGPHDVGPYKAYAAFNAQIGDAAEEIEALRHGLYLAPDDKQIAERLRHHGLIPGPSIALDPSASSSVAAPETKGNSVPMMTPVQTP